MTKHDFSFSDLTPPPELVMSWQRYPVNVPILCRAARWGAEQAAERLKGQWPTPITDRSPTEADGDDQGSVQYFGRGAWHSCSWDVVAAHHWPWLHTPRWEPPAPPTLTPQQQEAMDALDHILKHSTTNLGEATIRKAIMGGEA